MAVPVIKLANRVGIPCLEVMSINVTDTNVVFNFAEHPFFRNNFQGLFLVRNLQTFTAPASPLPVQFATIGVPGTEIAAKNVGNVDLLSTDFDNTGIYIFFYDRPTNTLQLISRNS